MGCQSPRLTLWHRIRTDGYRDQLICCIRIHVHSRIRIHIDGRTTLYLHAFRFFYRIRNLSFTHIQDKHCTAYFPANNMNCAALLSYKIIIVQLISWLIT